MTGPQLDRGPPRHARVNAPKSAAKNERERRTSVHHVTPAATRSGTVRLPLDLAQQLDRYCQTTGAVRSRVHALALRSYLGLPVPALPVARDYDPAPTDNPVRCEERV